MKKEELPKTAAFQDESTREMLDSTEEVEEGYYLFTSKTGGYSMLWPIEATKQFYENNGDSFERMIFSESDRGKNYYSELTTTYENSYAATLIEPNLNLLSNSVGYDGEYEKIEKENKTIYYAKRKKEFENEERKSTYYTFFSFIRNDKSEQGFEIIYSVRCHDEKNRVCNLDINKEEKRALRLMKSIKFNNLDDE